MEIAALEEDTLGGKCAIMFKYDMLCIKLILFKCLSKNTELRISVNKAQFSARVRFHIFG